VLTLVIQSFEERPEQ